MKYAFTVFLMQVEDHTFWAAKSSVLDGCVAQGETIEEAVRELESNENEWLQTARELDIPIPENTISQPIEYSGKFTVRMGKNTHRQAAEYAKLNGVSLNQYVNDAIVAANAKNEVGNSVVSAIQEAITNMIEEVTLYSAPHGKSLQTKSYSFNNNQYYNIRSQAYAV